MSAISGHTNRTRFMFLGLVLGVLVLGLALRLHELDADSMWLDEIKTAIYSRKELLDIPVAQARGSVHPPLHYLVIHSFVALLGTSDWVIRLPSALLGSASIVLAYKLGESLWTRKEGLVGAFLLAVNAYHVQHSQEARHYALMVFLVLFSLGFLIRALRRGGIGSWLGFALCSSLGIYTHYFAFLVLPAQVAFALWMIWKERPPPLVEEQSSPLLPRRQTLALVVSLLAVGASYVPWLPAMRDQLLHPAIGFRGFGGITESPAGLSLEFFNNLLNRYTGWDGLPLLVFLALFIIGLARCRREHLLLLGLWIVTPFVFLAVVQARHWFSSRYTIFILPICLLLAGRGICISAAWLERPLRRWTGDRQASTVLLPSLVILLGLLNVAPLRDYYTHEKEGWRGTAEYLAANLTPGDAIIADSTEYGPGDDADRVAKSLPYYLQAYGVTGTSVFRVQQVLWEQLTEWDQWNGGLWAVLWHPRDLEEAWTVPAVEVSDVSIVRLQEPSGHAVRDTERLLRLLLGMIPEGEARFDVHLALANIYIRTGRLDQAHSELQLASSLMPDKPMASASLEGRRARLEQLSNAIDGMQHPLWRGFGDEVALLGYNLDPESAQPGETWELTTWWYPLKEMNRNYTAFIHVLDSDASLWTQEDRLLRRGRRPTSEWKLGQVAIAKYQLELPADSPAGNLAISIGVYYWETGERLPVWDEGGQRAIDDVILLQPRSTGE